MKDPSLVEMALRRRRQEQGVLEPAITPTKPERFCANGCGNRLHKCCGLDVCAYCRRRPRIREANRLAREKRKAQR